MYHDIETDKILTAEELEKEWEYLWKNGETDSPTFGEYIRNCIDNGSLETA